MRRRDPRVLVIDDQPKTAEVLRRLAPEVQLVEVEPGRFHASSWRRAEPWLERAGKSPDLVVLDLRFEIPDEELLPDGKPLDDTPAGKRERRDRRDRQGLYVLERLRRRLPDVPVVLTTAHEEIPFEEEARRLRADAFTYAVGEEETTGEGILALVRRVLAEREAPALTGRFFWGKSAPMRELRRRLSALAPTPLPILVTGPTGTGKNFLAREVVHPLSGRRGPFVGFDCATVPESLLAAALFGSVKGAYTGSISDRAGVFEAAAGGTLFLDEIENLSADAQKLLLTALNDGVVRRLGATADSPYSARVVAASNADLRSRVASGSFRADLLMRLNPALALSLPPLSERREDLADLADLVAARFVTDAGHRREIASRVRAAGGPDLSSDARLSLVRDEDELSRAEAEVLFALPRKAWGAMSRHEWPGNVRQFEMVLVDVLAAAVYASSGPSLDRKGRAVFALDSRLIFDLLAEARGVEEAPREDVLTVPRPKVSTVEDFRRELEKNVYRRLFHETKGDFGLMSERICGTRAEERAVRLRFNKLGLSAREER